MIKRQLGLVLVLNGIHRYPGCHFNQVAAVKDAGYSFYRHILYVSKGNIVTFVQERHEKAILQDVE